MFRGTDRSITHRMIRAAMLDASTYEDVEHDVSANRSALLVVLLASLAYGLAYLQVFGILGFITGALTIFSIWVIVAAIAYIVGTRIFRTSETRTTLGELLRTLGFAMSPLLLLFLVGIPVLGWLAVLVVFPWVLITFVVALRQALDVSTGRAIGTAVISGIVYVGIDTLARLILI